MENRKDKLSGWQLLETPIVLLVTGITTYFTNWEWGLVALGIGTIIAHFAFGRK